MKTLAPVFDERTASQEESHPSVPESRAAATMRLIELMLRDRIGLDANSIGSSLIHRTVRLRMKALDLKVPEQYQQLLARSPAEWVELVESVVVTETWFFRDQEPFSALVKLLFDEWLPAHPTNPVRVLSLPCSSGEEPYSIAMALLNAGVSPERFEVGAIDISLRALARARRGVYGRNSFRGKDFGFREHYFKPCKEGFILNPAVRGLVRFSQGNLLGPGSLAGKATYDFIFCRNLLIYFDRPTQQKALVRIGELLTPTGVLFVGPAEQPLVMEHGFLPANIPMAFACRKAAHQGVNGRATLSRKSPKPPVTPANPLAFSTPAGIAAGAASTAANGSGQKSAPQPTEPNPEVARTRPAKALPAEPRETERGLAQTTTHTQKQPRRADLEYARRLADAGRLGEAAGLCEAHLRENRDSAAAYYLLGLIQDAQGDMRAVDSYRRALYLEPQHHDCLLQLALHAERTGDRGRGETYRRRAQRLKKSQT
jgi:chemotaxis protein methyltransferase WspC